MAFGNFSRFGYLSLVSVKLQCGLGEKTLCLHPDISIESRWHYHCGVIQDISIAPDARHIASIGSDNRVVVYFGSRNEYDCLHEFVKPQTVALE